MAALYQIEPYLKATTSRIASAFQEGDSRFCVALTNGIFFPKGGGQRGDRGQIGSNGAVYQVVDTVKDPLSDDGRPLCILEESAPELVAGQLVETELNWGHRFAQMRLHGIVHLHHAEMGQIAGIDIPVPVSSDLNADSTAFNRYETDVVTEELALSAFEEMKALIKHGAPVVTRDDRDKAGYRYWECLGFEIPCGGTHVADIAEIGPFAMSFSRKKGKPKVSFTLK
jgi:Ser-tRNA(Ala) deacylase AlaX